MHCLRSMMAFLAVIISASLVSEAVPLSPWSLRQLIKQSNSDLGGIDLGLAGTDAEQSSDGGFEKRYSGAKHTSQNSQSRDRAAVRKLFSLLVGKRSASSAEKRSGANSLEITDLPSSAFSNVHGYLLLAGTVTDDIVQEALDIDNALTDDISN